MTLAEGGPVPATGAGAGLAGPRHPRRPDGQGVTGIRSGVSNIRVTEPSVKTS